MEEFPIPAIKRKKLKGMQFFRDVLRSPKYVVAPMVDQSELAWRILSRRHGAQLCYSPMFHSSIFSRDAKYRREALQSCPEDRPLIIQFCGNDPETLLDAALQAQDYCDAIDINLGCPQAIAKRGHYGAFLMEEMGLISELVKILNEKLLVPVTCKIRIFEDKQKTLKYAKMLENSGCQLLTVHGRTRDQKGPLTGLADWDYVKFLKENLTIPVLSNGNIQCREDIHHCLDVTKADGVMTAEGNLYNPYLFDGGFPVTWDVANEYLDIVEKYPCPSSYIRGHLFKIFHHLFNLKENIIERHAVAIGHTLDEFRNAVNGVKLKFLPYHLGEKKYDEYESSPTPSYNINIPPWLCHSYIRPAPEIHIKKMEEHIKTIENPELQKKYYDDDGNMISRKLMKKLRRINRRPNKPEGKHERTNEFCKVCANPVGIKCDFKLCKKCCRDSCYLENLDCPGHRILIKTKRGLRESKADVPEKIVKIV